ncbi:chromosome partitioning protein ParB [Photobacterium swingsii]|uniref:Chromosome partitioning protein ParB n=1 Tax=Photobacterium swingsii TaxID=680026 RepID=A0A2T3PA20_9GAMM|nr:ParB/Srx family N-terminal domain-containing protein [Photobacterium swingsii]PSW25829.1 chromosome partitioning protein ParB [Photobacterium swingsii]
MAADHTVYIKHVFLPRWLSDQHDQLCLFLKQAVRFPLCVLTLFLSLLSFSTHAEKISYSQLVDGDIITVTLDQLLPTQAVMSYDKEYALLYHYKKNEKNIFGALCKLNGGGKLKKWDENSSPTDLESYTCSKKLGSQTSDLASVIVGPEEGLLYLTTQHHILSSFWDMPNGGTSVPIKLKVTFNLLGSGDDFWPEMNNDNEVWLYNHKGKKISPSDLPDYIGSKQLKEDKYLSLAYFLQGISYDLPQKKKDPNTKAPYQRVPYLALQWSLTLREKMNADDYNFNSRDEYAAALAEAATVMVDLASDEKVGKTDLPATAMGQFSEVDSKALETMLTSKKSEWYFATEYRIEKKKKSTPKKLLEEQEKAKQASTESSNKEKEKTNGTKEDDK